MNAGLYSGVSALLANQRQVENVASNLANVSTVGFKRKGAVQHSFYVGDPRHGHMGLATTARTDFSQGPIERTSNPLDLALFGDGFFAVEGPQGEIYTRNGTLQLDSRGVLTTLQGYPVAWDGSRREFDAAGVPIKIDTEGYVSQGGGNIGRLKIVSIPAKDLLEEVEGGYWRAGPGLLVEPSTAEVHQGAIERANVSASDELVRLISVQRSFETATKLLKLISESYERLNSAR